MEREELVGILEQIENIIMQIVDKFSTDRKSEGFSAVVKLVDLIEKFISIDLSSYDIDYDADEFNDMLKSLTEAMETGDTVLISDILEYRLLEFAGEIRGQID